MNNTIFLTYDKLKQMLKEFEELDNNKNLTDVRLTYGFSNNLEIVLTR